MYLFGSCVVGSTKEQRVKTTSYSIPTLEGQDLVVHQIPGLVDVAEELVVVRLWAKRSLLHFLSPPFIGSSLLPLLRPWGHSGDSQARAHC